MRILIIKLSSIGDLFHALPVVHNLKVGLNAQVDWVTNDCYVDMVKCFTDVDEVIPFYRDSFLRNFNRFFAGLRARRYDYIIDIQGLLKSALTARLARGKVRIGPSFPREGAHFFYTALAGERNLDRHSVEQCLDVVRFLGLERLEPEFPVDFPEFPLDSNHPRICIVPASRWKTKNWPEQYFAELLARLAETHQGASFYLLGGPGEAEVCGRVEAAFAGEVTNLAGKLSLVETGGFLKQVDLLISNDSGPVHMAVATGTPTLAIFGPTDPKRTGPYGEKHRVVQTRLPCQPCFSRTCRMESLLCMEQLSPELVAGVAEEMLAG